MTERTELELGRTFALDEDTEKWIDRVSYEAKVKECEALQQQIEQLREELGQVERRLAAWAVHGT